MVVMILSYIENHANDELREYFNILSPSYPHFLDKYINTPEMRRLHSVGFFCGLDYTKLHSVKYWYSRFDHSIACALMTWNFTNDKKQTIAALLHDLGTPAFSHCIDYLFGDIENQESSEISVEKILKDSELLMSYFDMDKIKISDVISLEKYTVLENKKPKLCVDRLDGVLTTGLIYKQFFMTDEIKDIYNSIVILKNEDNEDELGFKDINSAYRFFEAVYKYSMALLVNENKYALQFTSDCLKYLVDIGKISIESLYKHSEKDIISLIANDSKLKESWQIFRNASMIKRSDDIPAVDYYVSVDAKKRYVIPLCLNDGNCVRLNTVSKECQRLLDDYMNFEDSKYCFIEN